MTGAALAASLVVLTALPAAAQTPIPDSENGRYIFNQAPEGLLRLDSRTGHVSICDKRTVGWSCQMVPDERDALEREIARLQNENVTLKKELIARGVALPKGSRAPGEGADTSNELVLKLPNDADLDRAMTFFEKLWQRLIDLVQSMQKGQDQRG